MPGQSSRDLFQQAIDLFAQRLDEYASGIAQRLGQPLSGSQLSQQQVLERWNYTPLGDTQAADAQYHQLVAQGTPPGQALDQVYPFRKMLFAGPDLNAQIQTAQQIAGWDAKAKGQPEPETPQPETLPIAHWAASMLNQPPAATPPALPAGGPAGLTTPPAGVGAAAPGLPPSPSPAPGEMPPVETGSVLPIQPVPGVSAA